MYCNVLHPSGTGVSRLLCVLSGNCSLLHHLIEVLFNYCTTNLAVINHNFVLFHIGIYAIFIWKKWVLNV